LLEQASLSEYRHEAAEPENRRYVIGHVRKTAGHHDWLGLFGSRVAVLDGGSRSRSRLERSLGGVPRQHRRSSTPVRRRWRRRYPRNPAGAVEAHTSVATDAFGYRRLLRFAGERAPGRRVWAIEGTGSYGSGLASFLLEHGEWVVEVDRPRRPARRDGAKCDELGAARAAREALSKTAARVGDLVDAESHRGQRSLRVSEVRFTRPRCALGVGPRDLTSIPQWRATTCASRA